MATIVAGAILCGCAVNAFADPASAMEAIPGVAADVTLDPPRALVRMDRDVPEAALRAAIEGEGYRVVSVSPRVSSL